MAILFGSNPKRIQADKIRSANYPTRKHNGVVIYKDHRAVSRSKNLRGILDYARFKGWNRMLTYVEFVTVLPVGAGRFPRADVLVRFHDGATCLAHFESFDVACHWVESRRSWGLSPVTIPAGHGIARTYSL